MDDVDAAEALALAIALDPYGYGNPEGPALEALIDAWTLAMPDVVGNFAKRAVVEHYRSTGKRIAVADVITLAVEIEARDEAEARHAIMRQRREADRLAIPAPAPTRDRTADIAALLAEHRNWSPIGDLSVRRKQASWSPALEDAYRRAVKAKIAQDRDAESA